MGGFFTWFIALLLGSLALLTGASPSAVPTQPPPPPAATAPAATPLGDTLCTPGLVDDAYQSLDIAWEAQGSHAYWVDFLSWATWYDTSAVGDIEHHQRWVDNYQTVIGVLFALLEWCEGGGG